MKNQILFAFLFGLNILYYVEAYPTQHEPADNTVYSIKHCIKMTPENEDKVNNIVVKISDFLYNLTVEYDDIDIRLLKIIIEGHSDNETEEKDTQVKLLVNDCDHVQEFADAEALEEMINQQTDEEDIYEITGSVEVDDQPDSPIDDSNELQFDDDIFNFTQLNDASNNATNDDDVNNDVTSNVDTAQNATALTDNSAVDVEGIPPTSEANYDVKGPVLVRLDLDKKGDKLVKGTQAKRGEHVPLLLYIRKVLGNTEYLFGN
ncbi:uncharacterized protein LOC135085408 isoform X1 [Ostrinia nubilalis]|uniref:uncharacterized protein LOC135085408 isoform X1 n=2 Tax=Ostrinia nubilalis TaxID=29057 RepID=UPI0030823A6B